MLKPYSTTKSRAHSWQDVAARFLFIGLFVGSLLLVAIGRFEDSSLSHAKQKLAGVLAPIGHFIASPVETTMRGVDNFQQAISHAQQANHLASENEILQQWKLHAEQLQAENEALRRLLKVVPVMHSADLTARVLGGAAGPYRHQLQLAAGMDDGVKESMAVVGSHGLIGRVASVSGGTSQLLALTDINSRIAVVTGKGREHAVVKGLGEEYLALHYLPEDTKIQPGEKLYTSGDGGLMPPGILVGTVAEIKEGQVIVKPAVDRTRLDFVRLLVAKE